jgi:tetratricopeptide (TPR) repeat protein
VLEDVARAITVLEEHGDDRALAEAYELKFHALDRGTSESRPALVLERALFHARRAGSQYLEAWAQSWICIVLPFSNVPVPVAIEHSVEIFETAPNLLGRGSALGAIGLLRAQQGDFADARRLVLEAHATLEGLGLHQAQAAHMIARADVERLAGDLSAAEQLLRSGYERMRAFGDRHSTANAAWRLALVLSQTGRDEESERFTRVAEETVPHGFWVDVWWNVIRAGVGARAGRHEEADDLLRTALSLADSWDETGMVADVWIEAAGVLRDLGREAEADDRLERAAQLSQRLGYTVSEGRARELRRRSAGTAPGGPEPRSTARAEDA